MKKRRKHFYHCTNINWGNSWTARRIAPVFCGIGEPSTPRLCVSRTIAGCFVARLFSEGDVYVYKTAKKRSGIKPVDVGDSLLTGERWIVPPVDMSLIRTIPAQIVADLQGETRDYINTHWRGLSLWRKTKHYKKSISIFKEAGIKVPKWEENFVNKVSEYFDEKWKRERI